MKKYVYIFFLLSFSLVASQQSKLSKLSPIQAEIDKHTRVGGHNTASVDLSYQFLTDEDLVGLGDLQIIYGANDDGTPRNVPLRDIKNLILDLSYNKLTGKSNFEEIVALSNMIKLNLAWNDIKELPESVINFSPLRELNLSGNSFTDLPGNLSSVKIEKLIITNNKLSSIPSVIQKMHHLIELDCGIGNVLSAEAIFDALKYLPYLETLHVMPQIVDAFNELLLQEKGTFLKLKQLEVYELISINSKSFKLYDYQRGHVKPQYDASFAELDPHLFNVGSFNDQTYLDLKQKTINSLSTIDKLKVYDTDSQSVKDVADLTSLNINLSNQPIQSIPEEIKTLNIVSLNLTNNPELKDISNLQYLPLRSLILTNCHKIDRKQLFVVLEKLKDSLEKVHLWGMRFTPDELVMLAQFIKESPVLKEISVYDQTPDDYRSVSIEGETLQSIIEKTTKRNKTRDKSLTAYSLS